MWAFSIVGSRFYLLGGNCEEVIGDVPSGYEVVREIHRLAGPIVKVNLVSARGAGVLGPVAAEAESRFPDYRFVLGADTVANVVPKGRGKAQAIDVLCERLGIGLDQVVAFGDAGNDVEMLAHVPNSVAVANATPEAKAAARYVIGSCEDGAVAEALELLAAGVWPFG